MLLLLVGCSFRNICCTISLWQTTKNVYWKSILQNFSIALDDGGASGHTRIISQSEIYSLSSEFTDIRSSNITTNAMARERQCECEREKKKGGNYSFMNQESEIRNHLSSLPKSSDITLHTACAKTLLRT